MSQGINGLLPGDVVAVLGAYEHHIVFTGVRDWSFQNAIHNDKQGGVKRGRLEELIAGRPWRIARRFQGDSWQREEAVRYALSLEGTEYDLINFNCEHFSSLIQTGKPESPQLRALAVIASVGIGLLLLFTLDGNSS